MDNLVAKDIMTAPVLVVKDTEMLPNFLNLIIDHGINGMPVINEKDELVGIVTKTDLMIHELKRELNSIYETDLQNLIKNSKIENGFMYELDELDQFAKTITVTDIMNSNVITAEMNTSVTEICTIMKKRKIDHIVIMKRNAIAGIITVRDIIKILATESA